MNAKNSIWHVSLIRPHAALQGRLISYFFCLCLWLAFPLAVFTCSGWLGLALHWLAFSGAASLLGGSLSKTVQELPMAEVSQGESLCGTVKSEAIRQ